MYYRFFIFLTKNDIFFNSFYFINLSNKRKFNIIDNAKLTQNLCEFFNNSMKLYRYILIKVNIKNLEFRFFSTFSIYFTSVFSYTMYEKRNVVRDCERERRLRC